VLRHAEGADAVRPRRRHGHHEHGSMLDWLEYYYEHKLMLRLRRM
jgi:hypothetical protein